LDSDEADCPFETLGAWIVGKRRGLLKAARIAAKAACDEEGYKGQG
jgi:hypothetical protein